MTNDSIQFRAAVEQIDRQKTAYGTVDEIIEWTFESEDNNNGIDDVLDSFMSKVEENARQGADIVQVDILKEGHNQSISPLAIYDRLGNCNRVSEYNVQYVDHIVGKDGKVLVDLSDPVFPDSDFGFTFEKYIEQNELEGVDHPEQDSIEAMAASDLIHRGLRAVGEENGMDFSKLFVENDDGDLEFHPEEYDLRNEDYPWINTDE